MRNTTVSLLVVGVALVALGACESSKSSNPLSPSVAGPIPGVSITAPKPLQPGSGASIDASAQPLTLLLENASSTGVRPLTYQVEVALDNGFANKVFTREGLAPGGDGRTSLRLSDALAADRTYYWRARAQDGANNGPYSNAVAFTVFTPVVLEAPDLASPDNNTPSASRTPTFVITNARRSGPVGAVTYTLQLSKSAAFSSLVAQHEVAEALPNTKKTLASELAGSTKYYWRVRAWENSSRKVIGPWSPTFAFVTAAAPVVTPDPDPGTPPPGGSYPATGKGVIDYVKARYPSYLNAVGSLAQRQRNMEFLRDRVIERALCVGMRVGWNLKRGGPTLSRDYITTYKYGRWIGVDIANDYDNYRERLNLRWMEDPDDPYATYTRYTRGYSCG
jgi:hypothetical protein